MSPKKGPSFNIFFFLYSFCVVKIKPLLKKSIYREYIRFCYFSHCVAAHSLSHLGPEGYHWRVLIEDKPSTTGTQKTFSWWDIQDGNAKLPVKETSQYELRKLLFPSRPTASSTDSATKAAKGAFKMMGKAMASAIGDEGGVENQGPPVSVMVVKLLDLVKIHDKYSGGGGHVHHAPSQPRPRRAVASAPKSRPAAPQPSRVNNAHPRPPAARQAAPQPQRTAHSANRSASNGGNLMDFGDTPASRVMHHAVSAPSVTNPNETRAQRLKREQETKMKTSNRVWDDIDQRWIEVDPKISRPGGGVAGRNNNPGAPPAPKKNNVGIKLDMSNAAGKSAAVQKAMNDRVNEMETSRQKAVAEVKQRETDKKRKDDEEDMIRLQLEPKIKAWSEEHGKKKQLQALLANLHTILWNGTKWKQINIGDILQPSKCKKFYFKATLVVHPDKTHDLPAEQRFLAKRIFDALSQAKTVWDESLGK
ncbi:MAG: hypothetical protein ACI90V_009892 [Bacillariaceae sp.]|jgi:hypothetical protein